MNQEKIYNGNAGDGGLKWLARGYKGYVDYKTDTIFLEWQDYLTEIKKAEETEKAEKAQLARELEKAQPTSVTEETQLCLNLF